MKDKLKRYVRDNREAFDTKEPSDLLWQKMNAKLDKSFEQLPQSNSIVHKDYQNGGKRRFVPWGEPANWRIAASVMFLIGAIWTAWQVNSKYAVSEAPEIVLSNPNYAKQVSQYTQLIDSKRVELNKMVASNPELSKEFSNELEQLEQSYHNLKADLPQNPNQEMVIKAMLQNLQWQIDLLNQQLNIIQRIKNSKTYENSQVI